MPDPTIWREVNAARGGIDVWDFRRYVLGMLFYRGISEAVSSCAEEKQKGSGETSYAAWSDSDAERLRGPVLEEKGVFIFPGKLFGNVRGRAAEDANLSKTLKAAFEEIEASARGTDGESGMEGLFDVLNLDSGGLGATAEERNKNLVDLLDAVGELPIGVHNGDGFHTFGDAYEYLMTKYAAVAGISGGANFTPQWISELLVRITTAGKKEVDRVYDPACGTGSLLLEYARVLGEENVRDGFFGQEINATAYNLCRINMFLHGVDRKRFEIALGDTLSDPRHRNDKPFDAVVSNPPFSIEWEGSANQRLVKDVRFAPAGVLAPKSKADMAFVMHALSCLAENGTAAIICYPAVMYRIGPEQKIRKYLVDNNYIDAVIQLPADVLYGTMTAECVLVLKKNRPDSKVMFIDATDEFVRDPMKNWLNGDHIKRILDCFVGRNNERCYSRLVDRKEIEGKDYNISVDEYVASKDSIEVIDVAELGTRIAEAVSKQHEFRIQVDAMLRTAEKDGPATSGIDGLINRHRRNRVDFQEIGNVCRIETGEKVNRRLIAPDSGEYPVVDSRRTPVGFIDRWNTENDPVGIVNYGADAGCVTWCGGKYYRGGRNYSCTIKDCSILSARFLFHLLNEMHSEVRALCIHKATLVLERESLEKLKIPIPSISMQKEIVDVLDKFIELKTGLEIELKARQKQYEYCRNQILAFGEASANAWDLNGGSA